MQLSYNIQLIDEETDEVIDSKHNVTTISGRELIMNAIGSEDIEDIRIKYLGLGYRYYYTNAVRF